MAPVWSIAEIERRRMAMHGQKCKKCFRPLFEYQSCNGRGHARDRRMAALHALRKGKSVRVPEILGVTTVPIVSAKGVVRY